jgi:hypothetical protein
MNKNDEIQKIVQAETKKAEDILNKLNNKQITEDDVIPFIRHSSLKAIWQVVFNDESYSMDFQIDIDNAVRGD